MRVLFAIPFLPQDAVSVASYRNGGLPLSGSQGSALLVADALATKGHTVGAWVRAGQRATDSLIESFASLEEALSKSWDRVVLASWEDESTLRMLRDAGVSPLLWTHVAVERATLRQLEAGKLFGIIVVSDAVRLPLMHSSCHRQIGRVYNPLNPFYAQPVSSSPSRYVSRTVVFAGFLGDSRAQLVLEMWPEVRKRCDAAKLVMAGSGGLYRSGVSSGRLGITAPEFEDRYIQPIIAQFGSLENAGIEFTGLLSPRQLRELFASAALGFVNFNWDLCTETFCCVGAEMLATELPVFSFEAGALPETMGRTGGAVLCPRPDLRSGANTVARLLEDPDRLTRLGRTGRDYVVREYSLEKVTGLWEDLLGVGSTELSHRAGSWQSRRGMRYWVERTAGLMHIGEGYRAMLKVAGVVRRISRDFLRTGSRSRA